MISAFENREDVNAIDWDVELGVSKYDVVRRREYFESTGKMIWMNDDDYPNCTLCDTAFSLISRRHHCRFWFVLCMYNGLTMLVVCLCVAHVLS